MVFLSKDEPEYLPPESVDDPTHCGRIRTELKLRRNVGFFTTPDSLAVEVSVAINNWHDHPDFYAYSRSIVDEFSNLPPLPNKTVNMALSDVILRKVQLPSPEINPKAEEASKARIVDLPTAVAEEQTFLLVGEGGQGEDHMHALHSLLSRS